jgi:phosphate-selective porin
MAVVSFAFLNNSLMAQGCEEPDDDEDGVKVVGYIQPQFVWTNIGDEANEVMTFNFFRARLGVLGNIPYDFSYYFYGEYSPTIGGPALLDAFITYKGFGDIAKLSIGQFKSPFSLEQIQPCYALYTIERSRVVNILAGPIRDMGFMVYGKYEDLLNYRFGIMNGSGMNVNDNNTGKDYVGRAVINLGDFHVGGNFRYGKMNLNNADTKTRLGAELQYDNETLLVQAEYIWGDDPGEIMQGGCGGTIRTDPGQKFGYYGMVVYRLDAFWPVVKYEFYDKSVDIDDNNYSTITLGFSYFFNDWTRAQLNYMVNDDQANPDADNDALILQFQVKF